VRLLWLSVKMPRLSRQVGPNHFIAVSVCIFSARLNVHMSQADLVLKLLIGNSIKPNETILFTFTQLFFSLPSPNLQILLISYLATFPLQFKFLPFLSSSINYYVPITNEIHISTNLLIFSATRH
jgi:hypothetical protein